MRKEHMKIGTAYVNEKTSVAREIIEEVDDRRVRFNSFDLSTGQLIPTRHHICEKSEFARWAKREANNSERARIHPYDQAAGHAQADPEMHGRHDIAAARAMIESSPGHHTFPQIK